MKYVNFTDFILSIREEFLQKTMSLNDLDNKMMSFNYYSNANDGVFENCLEDKNIFYIYNEDYQFCDCDLLITFEVIKDDLIKILSIEICD